jgi:hypothetical protein
VTSFSLRQKYQARWDMLNNSSNNKKMYKTTLAGRWHSAVNKSGSPVTTCGLLWVSLPWRYLLLLLRFSILRKVRCPLSVCFGSLQFRFGHWVERITRCGDSRFCLKQAKTASMMRSAVGLAFSVPVSQTEDSFSAIYKTSAGERHQPVYH